MELHARRMSDSTTWPWLMAGTGFRFAARVVAGTSRLPTADGYRRLAKLHVG